MKPLLLVALSCSLLAGFAGCKRVDNHAHSASGGGGHVHVAPHGGTLVELGAHAYNLELVRDNAAGKLTIYVLDGHAENFVRIPAPALELVAFAGGERRTLNLKAVANSATGETVGDTSQFEADAAWLKEVADFPATLTAVEIKGTKFQAVSLYVPKSK